jgi:hypothetical protein
VSWLTPKNIKTAARMVESLIFVFILTRLNQPQFVGLLVGLGYVAFFQTTDKVLGRILKTSFDE